MTHQASESKAATATGDTFGSMLESFTVDELVDFLIATHDDPAGCVESDPAEWPGWTDLWAFVPTPDEEAWWARESCGREDQPASCDDPPPSHWVPSRYLGGER